MTAAINMTGEHIGHLVVAGRAPTTTDSASWFCDCDCGKRITRSRRELQRAKRDNAMAVCSVVCPFYNEQPEKAPVSEVRLTAAEKSRAKVFDAGIGIETPEHIRPKTRRDCANVPRPCPFVSCRHHLFLDVTETGGLKLNFPELGPGELEVSCSLDVADGGPCRHGAHRLPDERHP